MPSLYTEVTINAPIQHVWQVLTDKDSWMYWNTYLYDCSFRQPLKPGQKLLLAIRRIPGDEPIEFQATVTIAQSPYYLSWVAAIPGFQTKTLFELRDLGQGCTQYCHQESFSGLLSRFALKFIRDDQVQGIRRMARELKTYAERSL